MLTINILPPTKGAVKWQENGVWKTHLPYVLEKWPSKLVWTDSLNDESWSWSNVRHVKYLHACVQCVWIEKGNKQCGQKERINERKNKRKKGRITESKDKEENKESKDKRKEGGSTEARLPGGYFSWVTKARVSKARRSVYITIQNIKSTPARCLCSLELGSETTYLNILHDH